MTTCDYDTVTSSPYPDSEDIDKKIVQFKYVSPLVLVRKPEAIKRKSKRDPNYIVGKPYKAKYKLEGEAQWRTIVVPAGMLTDLASVPPAARWYVGRVGRHLEGAILHDYLYSAWQDRDGGIPDEKEREFADRLFRTAMAAAGVSWLKRGAIFKAVDWLGREAFDSREEKRRVDVDEIWECESTCCESTEERAEESEGCQN